MANIVQETVGTAIPDATLHGYVAEGQRTNLLTYSEQFDDASWSKGNVTVTANTVIAPDGKSTADTITTTNSAHNIRKGVAVSPLTTYTFSFYAKRGTMPDAKYSVYNGSVGGDIVSPTSYYASTSSSAFSKIQVTFTTPSDCTLALVYLVRDSDAIGTIYIWGAQLEQASFASSYIPTTSASVTRNADVLTYPSSNLSSVKGSLYVENSSVSLGDLGGVLTADNGTNTNRIQVGVGPTGQRARTFITTVGIVQSSQNVGTGTNGVVGKTAFIWDENYVKAFFNGSASSGDTSATMPSGLSNLRIGAVATGASILFGTIRNVKIWKKALTDAQLIGLTG